MFGALGQMTEVKPGIFFLERKIEEMYHTLQIDRLLDFSHVFFFYPIKNLIGFVF